MTPRWSNAQRLVGAVVLAATVALALHVLLPNVFTTRADREFDERFGTLGRGMTEREVIALLGEPLERTTAFRLAQPQGFEREYAAAAASGCRYYLLWRRELHVVYAVGFTADRRVFYRVHGGT